jgi:hypothetical protein
MQFSTAGVVATEREDPEELEVDEQREAIFSGEMPLKSK